MCNRIHLITDISITSYLIVYQDRLLDLFVKSFENLKKKNKNLNMFTKVYICIFNQMF